MYPHLALYINNKPILFPLTEARRFETVIDFLADMVQNTYLTEITSNEDFLKAKTNNEFAVVFKGKEHLDSFEIFAKNHKNIKMFWTNNQEVINSIGFKNGGVHFVFLRQFDEGDRLFGTNIVPSVWDFKRLIEQLRWPKLRTITQESFENILLKQEDSLILVLPNPQNNLEKKDLNNDSKRAFLQYSKNNEKFKFFVVEKEDNLIKELLNTLGRSHTNKPYLLLMAFDQHPYRKFRLEKRITFNNIKSWIEQFELSQLKESLKSKTIPEHQDPDIRRAVGISFKEEVIDSNDHIFLFIYSKWCDKSRKTLQKLKSIAIESKDWDIPVKWVAFEITQNETETLRNFQYYPALALYQIGRKKYPVWYDGVFEARNLENYLHFVIEKKKKYDEDL